MISIPRAIRHTNKYSHCCSCRSCHFLCKHHNMMSVFSFFFFCHCSNMLKHILRHLVRAGDAWWPLGGYFWTSDPQCIQIEAMRLSPEERGMCGPVYMWLRTSAVPSRKRENNLLRYPQIEPPVFRCWRWFIEHKTALSGRLRTMAWEFWPTAKRQNRCMPYWKNHLSSYGIPEWYEQLS